MFLFYKISIFSIFSVLIGVSETPAFIKVILISVLLFYLLPIQSHFFTKERLIRKFLAAFCGVLVFVVLFLFFSFLPVSERAVPIDWLDSSIILASVSFFISLGFFVYGVTASLISDLISQHFRCRGVAAAFVHIGFGLLLIMELSVLPLISALIFWMIDESLRKNAFNKVFRSGKGKGRT